MIAIELCHVIQLLLRTCTQVTTVCLNVVQNSNVETLSYTVLYSIKHSSYLRGDDITKGTEIKVRKQGHKVSQPGAF